MKINYILEQFYNVVLKNKVRRNYYNFNSNHNFDKYINKCYNYMA